MYSYEDRIRAVKLYIKLGKRLRATIGPLGYGSYLGEISPAPESLLNRDFQAATPNEKWLTDITEFQIPAGKVYLSPVIDCFDGRIQPVDATH